jgi:transposase
MLSETAGIAQIYIDCGRTDLRKGIAGLSAIISETFGMDSFEENVLYLFCGGRTDRIKGLIWEGDGFLLLYKRLEAARYQWPRNSTEVMALTRQQFRWLMEGLAVEQKTLIPRIRPRKTA